METDEERAWREAEENRKLRDEKAKLSATNRQQDDESNLGGAEHDLGGPDRRSPEEQRRDIEEHDDKVRRGVNERTDASIDEGRAALAEGRAPFQGGMDIVDTRNSRSVFGAANVRIDESNRELRDQIARETHANNMRLAGETYERQPQDGSAVAEVLARR